MKDTKRSSEDEQYLAELESEINAARASGLGGQSTPYSPAMFGGQQKQNLVEWQLDFRPELEDIERLLRSDILVRDRQGNEVWITNPNPSYILLNQVGTSDVIRQIRMFLNKNKVLSFYSLEEIKPRIRMLGHELRGLIYNNYEKYGIDNEYKMNNFSIIVLSILSMIEDSYRRALNGEERKGLNETRFVNQSDPIQQPNQNFYMNNQPQKKKHWYTPWRN